ncbi:hypothetical protein JL720_13722 [Aureococcus anophagefferens]|nr:hypothetical protein JL720_13722 [Aureococcus anophagefferens]
MRLVNVSTRTYRWRRYDDVFSSGEAVAALSRGAGGAPGLLPDAAAAEVALQAMMDYGFISRVSKKNDELLGLNEAHATVFKAAGVSHDVAIKQRAAAVGSGAADAAATGDDGDDGDGEGRSYAPVSSSGDAFVCGLNEEELELHGRRLRRDEPLAGAGSPPATSRASRDDEPRRQDSKTSKVLSKVTRAVTSLANPQARRRSFQDLYHSAMSPGRGSNDDDGDVPSLPVLAFHDGDAEDDTARAQRARGAARRQRRGAPRRGEADGALYAPGEVSGAKCNVPIVIKSQVVLEVGAKISFGASTTTATSLTKGIQSLTRFTRPKVKDYGTDGADFGGERLVVAACVPRAGAQLRVSVYERLKTDLIRTRRLGIATIPLCDLSVDHRLLDGAVNALLRRCPIRWSAFPTTHAALRREPDFEPTRWRVRIDAFADTVRCADHADGEFNVARFTRELASRKVERQLGAGEALPNALRLTVVNGSRLSSKIAFAVGHGHQGNVANMLRDFPLLFDVRDVELTGLNMYVKDLFMGYKGAHERRVVELAGRAKARAPAPRGDDDPADGPPEVSVFRKALAGQKLSASLNETDVRGKHKDTVLVDKVDLRNKLRDPTAPEGVDLFVLAKSFVRSAIAPIFSEADLYANVAHILSGIFSKNLGGTRRDDAVQPDQAGDPGTPDTPPKAPRKRSEDDLPEVVKAIEASKRHAKEPARPLAKRAYTFVDRIHRGSSKYLDEDDNDILVGDATVEGYLVKRVERRIEFLNNTFATGAPVPPRVVRAPGRTLYYTRRDGATGNSLGFTKKLRLGRGPTRPSEPLPAAESAGGEPRVALVVLAFGRDASRKVVHRCDAAIGEEARRLRGRVVRGRRARRLAQLAVAAADLDAGDGGAVVVTLKGEDGRRSRARGPAPAAAGARTPLERRHQASARQAAAGEAAAAGAESVDAPRRPLNCTFAAPTPAAGAARTATNARRSGLERADVAFDPLRTVQCGLERCAARWFDKVGTRATKKHLPLPAPPDAAELEFRLGGGIAYVFMPKVGCMEGTARMKTRAGRKASEEVRRPESPWGGGPARVSPWLAPRRHIDPMAKRLLLGGVRFDFVGRLEHLAEDWRALNAELERRNISSLGELYDGDNGAAAEPRDARDIAVRAEMSELVKTMIPEEADEEEEAQEIPLPNVKSHVLAKVIEFCRRYAEEPMSEIEKPLKSANMHEVVQEWYANYVDVDQELLFELILAANYMDIKPPRPRGATVCR